MKATEARADGYEVGYEYGLEAQLGVEPADHAPWNLVDEHPAVKAEFYAHRQEWLEGFDEGAKQRRADYLAEAQDRAAVAERNNR